MVFSNTCNDTFHPYLIYSSVFSCVMHETSRPPHALVGNAGLPDRAGASSVLRRGVHGGVSSKKHPG